MDAAEVAYAESSGAIDKPLSEVSSSRDVDVEEDINEESGDNVEFGAAVEPGPVPPVDQALPSEAQDMEIAPQPLLKHIVASKVPTELSRRTSSRTSTPQLPPRPPGVVNTSKHPSHLYAETWEMLPRLGSRLHNGEYAIVDSPHEDLTQTRLDSLLSYGLKDMAVLKRLHEDTADPLPPSVARPVTPDPHSFTFPSHVMDLIEQTRVKFIEIASLQDEVKADTDVLRRRAMGAMKRHSDAISQLGDAGEPLIADIREAFIGLECVNQVLSCLAAGFQTIPSVPWNWFALVDLLTRVDELRDLYATAWARFDVLEEDLRPVRSDMHRLQQHVASIQVCLDGIVNEALDACKPLLHNLYQHFTTKLDGIEQRLGRLDGAGSTPVATVQPDFRQVWDAITALTKRIDRLEKASGDAMIARIEGTIGTYFADRGLPDDVLRQLGTRFGYPPVPVESGGSISDALNTVYPPPSTGGHLPQPSSSGQKFRTLLDTTAHRQDLPTTSHTSAAGGAQRSAVPARGADVVMRQPAVSEPPIRQT
uniref:Alcohol oxidase n=1 Tax=Ganoderma boninense TaxID=34458 RepID=A0A5K1K0Y2_9APHY|nr:Alcohol oxidase [Ganoderma boninense]